jgi:hypothetical protein
MAGFPNWKLEIGGLVKKPLSLSLEELRRDAVAHPDHAARLRRRLERDRAVDGRASIASVGAGRARAECALRPVPLRRRSGAVKQRQRALLRDHRPGGCVPSTDHHGLRDERADTPGAAWAPLRLRVERQLGYKMAKYVMRIEVVDDFSKIGLGRGGYWEDRGYEWYAGI